MGINIRKKLLSYKKSVVLIGLIVLIIGSVLLTVNIFAETPADCIGTNVSTQHCCTCLAITASPGTISVGESSTLTLFLDNNPDAPSEDCSANGFSSGDGTAVCSINNGVLSDTTFNDGSYSFSVSPSNTTTYTATCSGIGGTKTDNVTVTVVDTTNPTISFNPTSRSWDDTNANITVTASDASGISVTYYCWTTGSSCTPGTSFANGSTLTQSSNGSWNLCVKARDNYNNETTKCSGRYQIDKIDPVVDSFSVDGHTSNFSTYDTSLTIAWSVSDSGGSSLSKVEVWRRTDGGGWSKINTKAISGGSDSGSWTNTVTCGHNYEYGIHVFDNAGNMGVESSTITATVNCNLAPTAAISCDPSGCNSSDCIGYTGCPFTLNNDSTDPDGQSDIVKSEWDILGWGDSPDLTCTANPLCNYTVQAVTPDTYTIQLYVEDSVGNSDTATKEFTIRREASAGFVCSFNNEDWISCDDISPSQGQIIYLSDSQPSPLEHSSPSEGASSIVSRKWEIVGGAVFSQDNESNPQISLDENSTIKLTITDNQGRSDSQTHQIGVGLPLPEWQETAP